MLTQADQERPDQGRADQGRPDQEQPVPGPAKRPKRDREATRRRLLEAARDLFSEHGYDHVSVRMIAAAAGANVALVNRYFGSKAALFGEVLAGESTLVQVVQGDPADLPRRLAEHAVRQVHRGPASPVPRMLDRSIGNPEILPILQQHMENMLVTPLADQLTGPGARARATLAATVIMGGGPVRRLLGLDDLRAADPDDLTDRLTAMFEIALRPATTGDPLRPEA
ncbi:TetR family transcriptional regulator [Spirillospora sp. NPDC048911]|uniref:TetR family transcriptional regulator n=1 Tax=Spirillospora sp. NPDC048911 TaxID=3364527 RepID=UPI0037195AE5